MWKWIGSHRGLAASIGVAGIALAVFALVWFEPQKLFIDERVDEALPAAATTAATTAPPTTVPTTTAPPVATTAGEDTSTTPTTTVAPTATEATTTTAGPVTLSDTEMVSVGRNGTGRVLFVELPDGSRFVRFEDLDVTNGPDLVVILSPSPLVDDRDAYDDGDFVSLGELKGNQGNQNYEIPPEVDLTEFGSVAIWCRRFNYTFTAAPIELTA